METKTLEKVFLCLRTNMFSNVEGGEHITLKYFQETSWKNLIDWATTFNKALPDTVIVKDYGTWSTVRERFVGARLQSNGILDGMTMPHITLSKEFKIKRSEPEEFRHLFTPAQTIHEVVDTLYIGKKIDGQLTYMPVDLRNIKPSHHDYLYS